MCRCHHGVEGTRVTLTLDPDTPPPNDDSQVVTLGTPTAWVIFRVLVESPDDIVSARALQHRICVTAPASHPIVRTERVGRATAIAKSGADVFSELQTYVAIDPPPPWHPKLSPPAQAILDDPSSVSEETLVAGIAEGEKRIMARNLQGTVSQNGWNTGRDAYGFGDDIVKRAAGAKFGLGGHQAIENRSYIAQNDSQGSPLNGTRPLQLRLAADNMPPCVAFWSLTAYGTDMYLVANEIDRWSISDRTPGLVYADDGSLTLYLSAEPPGVRENWLPVPAGPYLLGMRVYEGQPEVVACEWFPPAMDPIN